MEENAVLGPVDPQIGSYPAASILNVVNNKPVEEISDNTLIMADIAEKARNQVRENIYQILKEKFPEQPKQAYELAKIFTEGRWTHDSYYLWRIEG